MFGEFRLINNSIDIFHYYGRQAILQIFLWDKEMESFYSIPKKNLKEWVKALSESAKFPDMECLVLVDHNRADISKEKMIQDRENYRKTNFDHNREYYNLPGPYRGWLDS